MKKMIFSIILILLITTAVQANQEDVEKFERQTLIPNIKLQFDSTAKAIIVKKVQVFKSLNNEDSILIEVDTIDNTGKHTVKSYEKSLDGGHTAYWEIVTKDRKVIKRVTGDIIEEVLN